MATLFENSLDYLRNPKKVPSLIVNQYITNAWRLYKSKWFNVEYNDDPYCQIAIGNPNAVIIPNNWDILCERDPYNEIGMFLGGMCKIVDIWSGYITAINFMRLITGEHASCVRSMGLEADYLLTLKDVELGELQKELLVLYPEGFKSIDPVFLTNFELKPVVPGDFEILESGETISN